MLVVICVLLLCGGKYQGAAACNRSKKEKQTSQNDIEKPDIGRPDTGRPGADTGRPGADTGRSGHGQLLLNPDFETPLGSRDGWRCRGCEIMSSVHAHTGKYSGLVSKLRLLNLA